MIEDFLIGVLTLITFIVVIYVIGIIPSLSFSNRINPCKIWDVVSRGFIIFALITASAVFIMMIYIIGKEVNSLF
jgi:uncharacterized membrane protein